MEVAFLPPPWGIFFTNSPLLRNVSLWSSRKFLHGFGFLFDEIIWISIFHHLHSFISGNTRYLSRSVSCGPFQELFEKMMEECRMFGLRKRDGEQVEKLPSITRISLQTVAIQMFSMPTENRVRKNNVIFWKKLFRTNIRKKIPNFTEIWVLKQHFPFPKFRRRAEENFSQERLRMTSWVDALEVGDLWF